MNVVIDDLLIKVNISPHASERMLERDINHEDILDAILAVGEEMLDCPASKKIMIRCKEDDQTIICKFDLNDGLELDVITTIDDFKTVNPGHVGLVV